MDKKDKDTEIKDKRCFIITPIGETNSEIFRKAKGVIDSVIKPVLRSHGFVDIKPAYEITESGMIGNQIIDRIINDDLVVANLTGNNPNVMYELAIRHATAKPIIHICEKGTILPFDIKDNRTAFFSDDMLGVQELQKEFENYINGLSYCREYRDNPIYNGVQMTNLLDSMNVEGRKTEAELLQKILDKLSQEPELEFGKVKVIDFLEEIYIRISNCSIEKYDDVVIGLKNELLKEGLVYLGMKSDYCHFQCKQGIDIAKIERTIQNMAIRFEVNLAICKSIVM